VIDPRALASEQLRSGEHLLWVGQSDPRKLFTGRDGFLIPFSVLWCGIVTTQMIPNTMQDGPSFAWVLSGIFILVGLYMLVGRFLVKRHRKRTEVYAVTDRRVLITNGRSTRETDVHRSDRNVQWTRDRAHCSVQWETGNSGARAFFGGGNRQAVYANTGLDGVFGPRTTAFWDVPDGDALVSALDGASVR
jgi:hypothetical protein